MDIDSKFFKIVDEEFSKPFDWQTNNCGLFVGRIYSRIYGKDFTKGLKGRYKDEKGAWKFIKRKGGWEKVLPNLGLEEKSVTQLKRGDVVIADNALGIWMGAVAFFAGGATRKRSELETVYHYNDSTN